MPYASWSSEKIVTETLKNEDKISVNEHGNIINLHINNLDDYNVLYDSSADFEQKEVIKRITHSLYEKLGDNYKFIYLILNEESTSSKSQTYGYHTAVKNDIKGIGQGLFDFSSSYSSQGMLESIVFLPTKYDLIHGPSLHEIAHRWGNYLASPLDSLRHKEWLNYTEKQRYHFGYLSSGGQLGGWNNEYFHFDKDTPYIYMLNDGAEGTVGFSGMGPGNNSVKYSPLEQYLMGLVPSFSVPDLIEPASQPVESDVYPLYEIHQFNTITMEQIIAENGDRVPSFSDAITEFNTLFVVLSKSELTDSDWHNYEHQVNNFTRHGNDDYQRLYNFWEATDGNARLTVPDGRLYFQYYQVDDDGDGLLNYQEAIYGTDINNTDTDFDGISDFDEVTNKLDPLDAADALYDADGDGLRNIDEIKFGSNIYLLDTDKDGLSDFDEFQYGLNPLDPSDSYLAPASFVEFKSDVNGDGIGDWLQYSLLSDIASFKLIDGQHFTDLATFEIDLASTSTTLTLLADRNNDGVKEIGLFGFNKEAGRYQLYVYSGDTGQGLGVWNWPNTLEQVEFKAIADLTGDGVEEYAITGIHTLNGGRQLVVKDGVTKKPYQTFKWVDLWLQPEIVVMSDITGDNVPEVALYGRHKRMDKGQLFMLDGMSAEKRDVYNWNKLWTELSLHEMDDLDGDGTIDWGQFGTRKDDGRYQWVVKKGHDKRGVIRTFSWPNDLTEVKPLLIADRTGDGVREVSVYGKSDDGRVYLRVNDGRLANTRIANFSWPAMWQDEEVMELGDLNNDGYTEVGLLGVNKNSGVYQLIIKDGFSTVEYGRLTLDGEWAKLTIHSYDVNSDGFADIVVNGIELKGLSRVINIFSGNTLNITLQ